MADFTVPASLKATARNAVTGAGPIQGKIAQKQVACLEFDTDGTLAVGSYLEMIPASLNKNGLIIMAMKGLVTEVIAADTVAPIITVRDGATAPNTLGTLTGTNGDAVGDYVAPGSWVEWEALVDGTDYSAQHVEAGVKVEAAVTTLGSDAATTTGKILLLIEFIAIPSAE